MPSNTSRSRGKGGRGFASMSPRRHRQVSSLGGRNSHGGGRKNSRSSR